jgi:hypothetical protein
MKDVYSDLFKGRSTVCRNYQYEICVLENMISSSEPIASALPIKERRPR